MSAESLRQPEPYIGVLVGAVVVYHHMDVQHLGDGLLDLPKEAQELLVPMPVLALGDHLASRHIQGGEQGGVAVAEVVMRDPLHVAQPHSSSSCVLSRAWI
jgi:hypothetical protein